MKKLKYLGTEGGKHLYQYKNKYCEIQDMVASIYCDEAGETALCWLVKIDDKLCPIELWKDATGLLTWDNLLQVSPPEKTILVNPVDGAREAKNHPIIMGLRHYAEKRGASLPRWKIADPLHLFTFKQLLADLDDHSEIDWGFWDGARKTKEQIDRGGIKTAAIGSLAQGISYLWRENQGDTGGYVQGSFGTAPIRRGDGGRYIAGGYFSPRSYRDRFIR